MKIREEVKKEILKRIGARFQLEMKLR